MTTSKKSYPIDLECGHRLWFTTARHRPKASEKLWCRHCQDYCALMNTVIRSGKVAWPEGWTSEPLANGIIIGTCDYIDCDISYGEKSFRRTEQLMFQHHAIDHGKSSLIARYTIPKTPTPSEAPF